VTRSRSFLVLGSRSRRSLCSAGSAPRPLSARCCIRDLVARGCVRGIWRSRLCCWRRWRRRRSSTLGEAEEAEGWGCGSGSPWWRLLAVEVVFDGSYVAAAVDDDAAQLSFQRWMAPTASYPPLVSAGLAPVNPQRSERNLSTNLFFAPRKQNNPKPQHHKKHVLRRRETAQSPGCAAGP
jgi:hypothetical protein